MQDTALLTMLHSTLYTIMMAVCIITIPTLIIGVLISIVQAATQINEMTMTFIPKLIVMFLVLLTLGPWLMNRLVIMTQEMMFNLPTYIH
jgi:flagellar biosynthetic protein FliQ